MAVTNEAEDTDQRTKTPAFRQLQNHSEEVRADLRVGFKSVDELLLWLLDVSKYTLGWIPDDFSTRVLTDPYTVHAVLRDTRALETVSEREPNNEQRVQEIIEQELSPAFNQARGWLRNRADDHDSEVDADRQQHTALIPRVDHVAGVQRRLVETALNVDDALAETNHHGPIENRRDVSDWTNDLSYATQGFAPANLIDAVGSLGSEWRFSLTNTRGMGLRVRIAQDLMPAMNQAIKHAAESGMEQAESRKGSETEASIS